MFYLTFLLLFTIFFQNINSQSIECTNNDMEADENLKIPSCFEHNHGPQIKILTISTHYKPQTFLDSDLEKLLQMITNHQEIEEIYLNLSNQKITNPENLWSFLTQNNLKVLKIQLNQQENLKNLQYQSFPYKIFETLEEFKLDVSNNSVNVNANNQLFEDIQKFGKLDKLELNFAKNEFQQTDFRDSIPSIFLERLKVFKINFSHIHMYFREFKLDQGMLAKLTNAVEIEIKLTKILFYAGFQQKKMNFAFDNASLEKVSFEMNEISDLGNSYDDSVVMFAGENLKEISYAFDFQGMEDFEKQTSFLLKRFKELPNLEKLELVIRDVVYINANSFIELLGNFGKLKAFSVKFEDNYGYLETKNGVFNKEFAGLYGSIEDFSFLGRNCVIENENLKELKGNEKKFFHFSDDNCEIQFVCNDNCEECSSDNLCQKCEKQYFLLENLCVNCQNQWKYFQYDRLKCTDPEEELICKNSENLEENELSLQDCFTKTEAQLQTKLYGKMRFLGNNLPVNEPNLDEKIANLFYYSMEEIEIDLENAGIRNIEKIWERLAGMVTLKGLNISLMGNRIDFLSGFEFFENLRNLSSLKLNFSHFLPNDSGKRFNNYENLLNNVQKLDKLEDLSFDFSSNSVEQIDISMIFETKALEKLELKLENNEKLDWNSLQLRNIKKLTDLKEIFINISGLEGESIDFSNFFGAENGNLQKISFLATDMVQFQQESLLNLNSFVTELNLLEELEFRFSFPKNLSKNRKNLQILQNSFQNLPNLTKIRLFLGNFEEIQGENLRNFFKNFEGVTTVELQFLDTNVFHFDDSNFNEGITDLYEKIDDFSLQSQRCIIENQDLKQLKSEEKSYFFTKNQCFLTKKCPQGETFDNIQEKCLKCAYNCGSCIENIDQCLECSEGFYNSGKLYECLPCSAISPYCSSCSQEEKKCFQCENGGNPIQNCLCDHYFYKNRLEIEENISQCPQECSPFCKKCKGNYYNICESCIDEYNRYFDEGRCPCEVGYYMDGSDNLACKPCLLEDLQCERCQKSNKIWTYEAILKGNCTCSGNFTFKNGSCVDKHSGEGQGNPPIKKGDFKFKMNRNEHSFRLNDVGIQVVEENELIYIVIVLGVVILVLIIVIVVLVVRKNKKVLRKFQQIQNGEISVEKDPEFEQFQIEIKEIQSNISQNEENFKNININNNNVNNNNDNNKNQKKEFEVQGKKEDFKEKYKKNKGKKQKKNKSNGYEVQSLKNGEVCWVWKLKFFCGESKAKFENIFANYCGFLKENENEGNLNHFNRILEVFGHEKIEKKKKGNKVFVYYVVSGLGDSNVQDLVSFRRGRGEEFSAGEICSFVGNFIEKMLILNQYSMEFLAFRPENLLVFGKEVKIQWDFLEILNFKFQKKSKCCYFSPEYLDFIENQQDQGGRGDEYEFLVIDKQKSLIFSLGVIVLQMVGLRKEKEMEGVNEEKNYKKLEEMVEEIENNAVRNLVRNMVEFDCCKRCNLTTLKKLNESL